jgi:cation diffusion facilitator CzcD-associated flavoprotein CzcO
VPESSPVSTLLRRVLPEHLASSIVRWVLAVGTQGSYFLSKWRPEIVKGALHRAAKRQLPEGYDMRHFTPTYNPWDQRLCASPNGDIFTAIRDGKASVVTDTITRFDATGIELASGEHLDADIIITATGLEMLFLGGIALTVDGEVVDAAKRLSYKGMMLDGVPNLAYAIGYANASWTLKCDLTCDYVTRMLNHMHNTGLQQATPDASGAEEGDSTMFALNSGYLNRARHLLPRQGKSYPWQVKQSYIADYRAMKMTSIEDDVMRFTNPVRAKELV